MSNNVNNKKALAEQLKAKLNSSDYVAMSDLIFYDDRCGDMLTWIWGRKINRNWISGTNINPGKGNKHESEHVVYYEELEPNDWEEIVNLIQKRNKEKEQIYEQKRNQIKERLNNTPNLYYRFSTSKRISTSYFTYPDKHGEYFHIWGVENGREYFLNININHPVLNNFPWEKNGYYLIETDKKIERNDKFGRPWSDYGESNPSNFHKWVEVGDKITITPYEVANEPVKKPDQKEKCASCGYAIVGADYYKVDGKVYHSGCDRYDDENDNSNQPTKNFSFSDKATDGEVVNYLLQYFQDNGIKKIKLKNRELVIEYNDNKSVSSAENNNDQELQLIKNIIQKNNQQELSREELSEMVNNINSSTNNNSPNNNNALWLGVGGVLVLMVGMIIGLLLSKKNKKH